MEFLKKFDLTLPQLAKLAGIVVLALVVLSFVAQFVGFGGSGISFIDDRVSTIGMSKGISPQMYSEDGAYDEESSFSNIQTMPDREPEYTPGDTAEDFEVKEYSATIETQDQKRDCDAVHALKARDDVVFESANMHDRGCSFTFKVKNESVENVLTTIQSLDPKELTETVYTIKRQIDRSTSDIEILEKKLATIEETLTSALSAYSDITNLASRTENADALARVISSKVSTIRQLTDERLQTSAQLDRMSRSHAEALDRLAYANFNVSVYENKFIDGVTLKDSWKSAIRKFVNDTNILIQELSIGLVSFLLIIVQLMVYFFILVFVARFGFVAVKRIWKREESPTNAETTM
jgi:hypothetical protein